MIDSYFFHLGLGPRPLIDFPDSVQMDDVIVKVPGHKVLFVRNIGQLPATFSLIVDRLEYMLLLLIWLYSLIILNFIYYEKVINVPLLHTCRQYWVVCECKYYLQVLLV